MKHFLFFLLFFIATTVKSNAQQPVNIVYIGNSITQGVLLQDASIEAPPAQASLYLKEKLGTDVNFRNCGVSGMTTLNFLPVSKQQFPNVKSAADELSKLNGTLLFSISLGTNDSACSGTFGAPVVPEQYYTNLEAIIDELLRLYPSCQIIIQSPIWYSPNTYNGTIYLNEGLQRLISYFPMIPQLVESYDSKNPGRVYLGDTLAFNFFKEHYKEILQPEEGNAGTFYLHPNKKGAEVLGKFWAEAILKIL